MHHKPAVTRKLVVQYVATHDELKTIHYDIRRTAFADNVQLQKYYDSGSLGKELSGGLSAGESLR